MAENVDTSALIEVSDRSKNGVPENEVPGTAVPENNVNSGSDTAEAQNEPKWYRDGDAWVKIFLEPIEPGKFKQHDYVYNVPGENEFPKERWSSAGCKDGFHITRRKDVWAHLPLHGYKSAYIAEVVSMGSEFYDNPDQGNRKVRVVAFGPAVLLADVLGKHPDDFKNGLMLVWSVTNNHIELLKLAVSKKPNPYYGRAFDFALEIGSEQIADFLIENCDNDERRQEMLNYAICHGRVDFVKRLMENTSVNTCFFQMACENGQFEIFQLFRAKYGEPSCSDIIYESIVGGSVGILAYLKSRGVDMSDFGMFVYACTHHSSRVEMVEYLVSEGADVKDPIIAYIAKRYAIDKEAREYLLSQIDDKSEVPECEELEAKIGEICNIFFEGVVMGEREVL
jgi:hypothetical protein